MQQDPKVGSTVLNASELTLRAQESLEMADEARAAGDERSAKVHEWNARRYQDAVKWRLRDRPSE